MVKEKALVVQSKWTKSKILQIFNKIVNKFRKNKEEKSIPQSLNDMEVLRELVEGRKMVNDIDIETKKRLIKLCDSRTKEVKEKVEEIE